MRPVQDFSPVKCVKILPGKCCLLIHPKLRAYFSNLTPMRVALIAEEKRQGRYPWYYVPLINFLKMHLVFLEVDTCFSLGLIKLLEAQST